MSVQCLIVFMVQVLTMQLLTARTTHGQNLKDTKLSLEIHNKKIVDVFKIIEQKTDYIFVYPDEIKNSKKKISLSFNNESLEEILIWLRTEGNLKFRVAKYTITATFDRNRANANSNNQAEEIQTAIRVTGNVTDETGAPLPGVNILIKGTGVGTTTNAEGSYVISVPQSESVLVFSFIGYQTKEIVVGNQTNIDVVLTPDIKSLQEVVVVGYGEQKKVTLTGAVSAISSKDLVTTKNENIQNALTGKLPGVRVVQKTSEPGVFTNDFDIRGFGNPLIIIDGIPRTNIARLDPNDIESISVLKDASAAVYGVRAANGVVLITTKKGKAGVVELNYSGMYGIQKPSGLPKTIGAADWLTLVNEKYLRGQGLAFEGTAPHTQELISEYRNGTRESIDWYPDVIQNTAPQSQHNLSATGGTDNVNYFISLGYLTQEGFFKSGDLNYERYNVRSNISAKISNAITADLQISGIIDERNQPFIGTWEIFKALWRQNPIDPKYANNNPEYLGLMQSGTNAIAIASADISGYQKIQNKWLQSSFSLSYDLPFIDGLVAKGMVSYDYRVQNDKSYQKEYALYIYDELTGTYPSTKANAPSAIRRYFAETPLTLLQASLNYKRLFGKHNVNALALYEEQTRTGDNFYARRELALTGLDQLSAGNTLNQQGAMSTSGINPDTRKGLVARLNYDYDSKYIAEFSFRYDASNKFPKDTRWGFFPGGSLGWRISEENFFGNADALHFISNLKLRASYGVMGDDEISQQFQFITGYIFPAPKGGNNTGLQGGTVFNGDFVPAIDFKNLPNPNITWYEVKTLNVGLDAELWQGLLGVQLDIFRRNRDGLLYPPVLSVPGSLGATLPQENLNSDQVNGMEIVLSHRNRIGADFGYNVSGNFSLTRTKWLTYHQAEAVNSYDNWRRPKDTTIDPNFVRHPSSNRYSDILWGYEVIGQFQSYEEIYNSDVHYGPNTLPGDFKYLDWNGDGVINDDDIHPIANNNRTPKVYFGFSAGVNYKQFDLNLLFQGASLVNVAYPEQLMAPLAWDGSALDYFMDRWRTVEPGANPYDPNTEWIKGKYPYGGSTAHPESSFQLQDASYLRLKSLEIGYTLPPIKGIKNARIYANGYNLFTVSGIKYVDPEHPADTYGYIYPLNKTYNIGINLSF